jgi:hypothetical protein
MVACLIIACNVIPASLGCCRYGAKQWIGSTVVKEENFVTSHSFCVHSALRVNTHKVISDVSKRTQLLKFTKMGVKLRDAMLLLSVAVGFIMYNFHFESVA